MPSTQNVAELQEEAEEEEGEGEGEEEEQEEEEEEEEEEDLLAEIRGKAYPCYVQKNRTFIS